MSISRAACALAFGLIVMTASAGAATRYISDQLSINMRRGPGTGYRIQKLLGAGDQVRTISKSDGWTKVKTGGGETGYVLTRFLSDKPAASTRVSQYKTQNKKLQTENKQLKGQAGSAKNNVSTLNNKVQTLSSKNKTLSSKLEKLRETSADAVRINKQNQKYHKQLMSLRSTVERLKHQNQALESRREGMKIGALILFVGIIVGLLLSLMRRRKSSNWNSF